MGDGSGWRRGRVLRQLWCVSMGFHRGAWHSCEHCAAGSELSLRRQPVCVCARVRPVVCMCVCMCVCVFEWETERECVVAPPAC